ncbi:MAG: ABC transporter permease [Prevotellaceae bacterium]|jgi:putative ABC transport system permease protein|nr:ABC transporter permease [Prevotellaceae bacterium]
MWQEIWITITKNKSRSVLTAFGVFWGMFMLVVMTGAGTALEHGIMGGLEGIATNSCYFAAGRTSIPYKGFRKDRRWDVKYEDYLAVKQTVKGIEYISPAIFNYGINTIKGDKTGSYTVAGYLPEFQYISTNRITQGRNVNDIDILQKRKVCLIGKKIYAEMFKPGENPIGQYIQVNGIYFQIIGVVERISSSMMSDPDQTIMMPLPTVQQIFNMGNIIHWITITAKSDVRVSAVQQQVSEILKKRNNIAPEDGTAVFAINIEEEFDMFRLLFIGISALIWIVGLGTLIAGGIGISNIMLVTVRERTKEIGIRRALGATPRNIIIQIMSESIVLTTMAGIAGLMFGVGVLQLVSAALSQSDGFFKNPQISFGVSIGALVILLVIGTVAGYMPARRAMRIKPIEAIREE